jgi:predicted dinucleotide-binding enzyme
MRIAIIGTGPVGAALGRRFAGIGHQVSYASRDPGSAKALALLHDHSGIAALASHQAAAASCELALLCVPAAAVAEAVAAWTTFTGIVIDVVNPLLPDLSALRPSGEDSAGEQLSRRLPAARVVKAFNTVGHTLMTNPLLAKGPSFLPVCGDDAEAKRIAIGLAHAIGFDASDAGPLRNARYTEAFAMLWIQLAFAGKGFDFGFVISGR